MSDAFDDLITPILISEGGYVNNPADTGGETNWGITVGVARANGYSGPMVSMTRDEAAQIYRVVYWQRPGFAMVAEQAQGVAAELLDCGINMGVGTASAFLQRCLNVFNRQQQDYADIAADGQIGSHTLQALSGFIARRATEGEQVLLKAMRCLRGAHYIALAEARQQNETFVYGWIANRIKL